MNTQLLAIQSTTHQYRLMLGDRQLGWAQHPAVVVDDSPRIPAQPCEIGLQLDPQDLPPELLPQATAEAIRQPYAS